MVLNLHTAPLHCKKPRTVRNIGRLQDLDKGQCFQVLLNEKLTGNLPLVETCSGKWMQFKGVTVQTVLGTKGWFDKNYKIFSAALQAKNKVYVDW